MNILIQALQQFEGTFITVSHDRYFISNIANKIWWIEEDQIKEYLGTYDEWKYFMLQREKSGLAPKPKQGKTVAKQTEPQELNTQDANVKLKKQMQKQADEVEQELERLKKQKIEIEKQISEMNDQSKIGTLSEQYKVLEDSIVSKNKEFETIFEQLLSL
jgi:ATP-binding cassette subfamily F protein 3